jgi:hypothetical protein
MKGLQQARDDRAALIGTTELQWHELRGDRVIGSILYGYFFVKPIFDRVRARPSYRTEYPLYCLEQGSSVTYRAPSDAFQKVHVPVELGCTGTVLKPFLGRG